MPGHSVSLEQNVVKWTNLRTKIKMALLKFWISSGMSWLDVWQVSLSQGVGLTNRVLMTEDVKTSIPVAMKEEELW